MRSFDARTAPKKTQKLVLSENYSSLLTLKRTMSKIKRNKFMVRMVKKRFCLKTRSDKTPIVMIPIIAPSE